MYIAIYIAINFIVLYLEAEGMGSIPAQRPDWPSLTEGRRPSLTVSTLR